MRNAYCLENIKETEHTIYLGVIAGY